MSITGTVESFTINDGFNHPKWGHYGKGTIVVDGQTFSGDMMARTEHRVVGAKVTVNPHDKKKNNEPIITVKEPFEGGASSGGGFKGKTGSTGKSSYPTSEERSATQERITRDAAVNKALAAIEIAVAAGEMTQAMKKKYSDPSFVVNEAMIMADGIAASIKEDKLASGFVSKGQQATQAEAEVAAQAPAFDDEIPY